MAQPQAPQNSPSPSGQRSGPSQPAPTVLDALSTISPLTDLQRLPQVPCARYSLMFGILAGTSVGALRFIFTARRGGVAKGWGEVASAANWAVGTWGVGSLGAWETCRRRQSAEASRMQHLVNEVKAKRAAKLAAGKSSLPPSAPAIVGMPTSAPLSGEGGELAKGSEGKSRSWWPWSK